MQFAGHTPRSERPNVSRHVSNLEERHVPHSCCSITPSAVFDGHDRALMDPSSERNELFGTDLGSLASANGDAVTCSEVCHAICISDLQYGPRGRGQKVVETSTALFVDTGLADSEVLVRPKPQPLHVPAEFAEIEYVWLATAGGGYVAPSEKQQVVLRHCLKRFVRSLLTGVQLQLRMEASEAGGDAQNFDAVVVLNQDMKRLFLTSGGHFRGLPVQNIKGVRPPAAEGENAQKVPESERARMVVLRMSGGLFVRLRFRTNEQAAYFGLCLRQLVKAVRGSKDLIPEEG